MDTVRESTFPIPGFLFAGIKCGIKYPDKYDMGLIYSKSPCTHSAVYTQNKVVAAPVSIDRSKKGNLIQAILVNSNNANACTGTSGFNDTNTLISKTEELLNSKGGSVLMSSTGVIGVTLPVEKMLNAIPSLVSSLDETAYELFAQSMMTTDTKPKSVCLEFDTSQGIKKIGAFVKGSGMIAPNMATLLAFLVTDATVPQSVLDEIFRRHVARTFNAITIDGDMSTNDTAVLLSKADNPPLSGEDIVVFEKALSAILEKCAVMLVLDGEGSNRCIKIEVSNAKDETEARLCAKSIAESLLVKTAFFGKDPNWGRIACAAGYSGCEFDPGKLDIHIGSVQLMRNGEPLQFDKTKVIIEMDRKEYTVKVNLNAGNAAWHYWTADLSYEYVRINAEYTT